jgi:hypothetical protein
MIDQPKCGSGLSVDGCLGSRGSGGFGLEWPERRSVAVSLRDVGVAQIVSVLCGSFLKHGGTESTEEEGGEEGGEGRSGSGEAENWRLRDGGLTRSWVLVGIFVSVSSDSLCFHSGSRVHGLL